MRIAVCDDDKREISRIRKLIAEYETRCEKSIDCQYFMNSTEFLCDLRGGEYDLVLMDVLMPGVSGLQAAQELRERDKNVRLIFVSASPEFAVESYRVGAYYYLLKPIDAKTFFSLLDKIGRELSAQLEQGFVLKSREGVVQIAFAKLVYVEVMNKTVFFHLADDSVRETTATLADVEGKLLRRPEFLKTHRSYFVNLNYIQVIDINCVIMKSGDSVPVSRQRRSQVQDAYMNFLQQSGTEDSISDTGKLERPEGPWRILLVDDDPADSIVWADILQCHGCIVDLADSGEDALRLAMSEHTQLCYGSLLLDLAGRRVLIDEKELSLTPIEFDILSRLSERAAHIFTPEEIFDMI